MDTTLEKTEEVAAIIDKDIASSIDACIKDIQGQGGFEPTVILYDNTGQGHLPPIRPELFISDSSRKQLFVPMMKGFIDFLKQIHDTTIVESVLYQCVYHANPKKHSFKNTEDYLKKHGSVSQDPNAEEALMVLRETPDEVRVFIYHAIYSDDQKTGVVSPTPTQEFSFNKNSEGKMESWMLGSLYNQS